MIFLVFLFWGHIFTFPSVKQRATSDALFGLYPDSTINPIWNPASIFDVNKYWLDLLRLKKLYNYFKGYRTIFPIIHNNKLCLGGMVLLSEESPDPFDAPLLLYEYSRGEVFFGYNGTIKHGISIFVDRIDWWHRYPWDEGWNYIFGGKFGFILPSNTSFSITISKEDTASTFEWVTYFSHVSHNYGVAILLPNEELNFIGAYHVHHLRMGKFIKAIRIGWKKKEIKYFIPLVLDFNIFKQLDLHGGYTIQIKQFDKVITTTNFISMGFTYKCLPFAAIVSVGKYPFNTNYWEVSLSYGN